MKKKNLLKCLALTSMLALSVGAVTSCGAAQQGATGPKGDKGDTGAQGVKGEDGKDGTDGVDGITPSIGANGNWWIGDVDTGVKASGTNGTNGVDGEDGKDGTNGTDGKDGTNGVDGVTPNIGENGNWWIGEVDTGIKASPTGENGKTYMPIMVYGDAKNYISQDKYFVEVGDTFTLSWNNTGKEDTLKIMTGLEINGEIVDYELGATSWTHTVVEGDKGWQVTDFTYGTLLDYATKLLREHYNSIAEADLNVDSLNDSDTNVTQDGKLSYFKGDSVYSKFTAAKTALGTNHTANKLKDLAVRLASIKEELNKQIAAIDKEYATLVSNAKSNALAGLKKLYENSITVGDVTTDPLTGRKDMTNTDREALLAIGTEMVNKATTLYGIGSLVKNDTGNTTVTDGSINKLEGVRAQIFDAIHTTLSGITYDDTALNDTNIKETRATLKTYGIEVLPNDVAKEYIAKTSAATEFPKNDDGDALLGVEALAAIDSSYKNIVNTLSQAIVNKYYADIDKSTTMDSYLKNVAKGLVSAKVSNWFTTTAAANKTIAKILGDTGPIQAVENAFEANYATYSAFNNERKAWVAEEAYTALDAQVAKYLEDSVYAALLDSTTNNGYKEDTAKNVKATLTAQKEAIRVTVEDLHDDDDDDDTPEVPYKLANVKTAINTAKGKIDTAYTDALALYKTTGEYGTQPAPIADDTSEKINIAGDTSGLLSTHRTVYENYISAISGVYNKETNKLGAQSFTEYKGLIDGVAAKLTALKALDAGYATWLETKADDTGYITTGTALVTDLFYTDDIHKALETLASEIMSGTKTSSDASIFVAGLESSYNKGIAELASVYTESLPAIYNAIIGATPSKLLQIKAVYDKLSKSYGSKVKVKWTKATSGAIDAIEGITHTDGTTADELDFEGKTYKSVQSWYNVTYKLMQSVAEGGTVVFVE